MLIILFLVLAGILGISAFLYSKKKRGFDDAVLSLLIIGCIVLVMLACGLTGGFAAHNLGKSARMEMFYNVNAQNYANAVQETDDVLSVSLDKFVEALVPLEGSVEKMDVGQEVALRIKEWRDSVNTFNNDLAGMRRYDGNVWTGILYPTLPDDIKPIQIQR